MLSEKYAISISNVKITKVDKNIYFGFCVMNVTKYDMAKVYREVN